ncbi:BON domain-containing protein [Acidovorax sp.]|jgi:osmotically-inducible protein OsmY|uniref:BON domain-containing protein n=1 Tax=Acidovorax sp. TaxID=1872122 RepID=UPI0025BA8157|nr:BON domain-containing protein [Acidovorax sp.]
MKHTTQALLLTACCTLLLSACGKTETASPMQAPPASAADNVSDVDVTTHVNSALKSEPNLAGQDIVVVTTKGDIRLTGVVESQEQIDTAISAARAAEGAHTIHNELTVKQ